MQRMGSVPILYININVLMNTALKFHVNADANVDFDPKCEWSLTAEHDSDFPFGKL